MAATDTPVMNVSGQGSDYIFVYQGNDTATYADLSALGNSIIGWTATCTSGSCTVGDVLYVGGVGGNEHNDYLFLYTEDSDGNVAYPVSGAWYSFEATQQQHLLLYTDQVPQQQHNNLEWMQNLH